MSLVLGGLEQSLIGVHDFVIGLGRMDAIMESMLWLCYAYIPRPPKMSHPTTNLVCLLMIAAM